MDARHDHPDPRVGLPLCAAIGGLGPGEATAISRAHADRRGRSRPSTVGRGPRCARTGSPARSPGQSPGWSTRSSDLAVGLGRRYRARQRRRIGLRLRYRAGAARRRPDEDRCCGATGREGALGLRSTYVHSSSLDRGAPRPRVAKVSARQAEWPADQYLLVFVRWRDILRRRDPRTLARRRC